MLGECEGSTAGKRSVRGDPSAEVTSEQKPKGKEGVSYRGSGTQTCRQRDSTYDAVRQACAWQVPGVVMAQQDTQWVQVE